MDTKLARNLLKADIAKKKSDYEASMKLDQALAYYEGLESKIKDMDNEDKVLTASVNDRRTQLSALDYKLEKKTKEIEAKITKAENDGAEKLDDAHQRYGDAERETINAFKKKEALYEDMLAKLEDSVKEKRELLAKMDKSIDKHKKEFGSLVNA